MTPREKASLKLFGGALLVLITLLKPNQLFTGARSAEEVGALMADLTFLLVGLGLVVFGAVEMIWKR